MNTNVWNNEALIKNFVDYKGGNVTSKQIYYIIENSVHAIYSFAKKWCNKNYF